MSTPNTSAVRSVVDTAMDDLVDRIREEAKFRGKVASGRTLASLRTTVLASDTFLVATLSGADNWKYWGNGRGPGRMPPVSFGPVDRQQGTEHERGHEAHTAGRHPRLPAGRRNPVLESITAWQWRNLRVRFSAMKVYGEAFVQEVKTRLKEQPNGRHDLAVPSAATFRKRFGWTKTATVK